MPDASIVVKATDRYSEAMKKMASVTKSFSKDVDQLEDTLYALNKNKYSLKLDASKAKAELKAAEKQFDLTHSAADGLKKELAQANYDNIVRNMKAVTTAARDTEKAISKVENRPGGSSGAKKVSELATAVAASGIGDMAKDLALSAGSSLAGSLGGDTAGTMASSMLSSMATGAAAGALFGPAGAAIGAAAGGIIGAATGGLQIFEKKDDAFKSYVEDAYETVTGEQSSSLTSGSSIAGSREQTRMAFAQRMGEEEADAYLKRVKTMATSTNYNYDEITGYSKLLLNTYGGDKTLSVLQTLSDASAGLNLDSSDVNMFISGLSRMRTTGKATQEYLNYFSERGVDVYQALANSTGADKSKIAEMVTGGKISGADAHMYLLSNEGLYINETYGGLSEKLATTYDAMVDNLADFQADMDAAMGEGYNEGRKEGLQAQMDWVSGESGAAVEEANRAIGAWQAELENSKEQYIRDAMDAMMASDEYQTAKAEGDAAEMGKLIMQAKVQGMNEYNASDGAQLALESEMSLVTAIRNDTGLNQDYWDAGYEKGQEFTKGLAAARKANYQAALSASDYTYTPTGELPRSAVYTGSGYATGIDYVPYDNFPALLHQGERVQTAEEARSEGSSDGIQIVMYGTTIREDADVDRVAAALLQKMQLAGMRG